jgi:DNA-binding NtrC family response regulator
VTDTGRTSSRPRILVVDDDPAIRRFIVVALGSLDAEIVEAGDGAAVVRAARAARPDLPRFVMTGWSAGDASASLGSIRVDGWLEKPFTPADLRSIVAATLAGDSGPSPEA